MISKLSFFLGCFALLMFLVITTEADARGRGGGGRGGGRSVSRSGPASSGSVRGQSHQRRDTRQDVRSDRRDRQQDVRGDRRDHRQDRYDDRRDFQRDRYDDRRDFREDVYRDRRRMRVGAVLTTSTFRALSCRTEVIIVGNVTYYRCGSGWYSRAYHGGSVTYVVVTAPAGY